MKFYWAIVSIFLFVLIVILCPKALADEYSFKMGLGIINKPTSEVKAFGVRHESKLFAMIHDATEFGLWTDTGKDKGRKGAAFVQYQWGIRPQSEHLYAKAFIGASALTSTDSQLGGNFQFAEDFGFGFQDKDSFVGLCYGHKSSAGFFRPNKGRDFLQLELGIRF